jgi:ribonuclease J
MNPKNPGEGAPKKYFQSKRREFAPEQTFAPGASFVAIPKFKNKRAFPFVTPQNALKKFIGQEELAPTPTPPGVLRIIPLGGVEQVGLNCTAFEYDGEVLIIDMGIQFADQYQHGINGSIPDLAYLRDKKLTGIVITHGHIDHIGAIPFIIKQLGRNVPLYATSMAYELIAMKQGENGEPLTKMARIERNATLSIGSHFQIMPFTVDHSIPDSVGIVIETPVGRFVHTGDWKFDSNPLPYRPSTDYSLLESIGNRGVRALLSDSTNAHLSGSSLSESDVIGSIEEIFKQSEHRIITATFSSIIDRVMLMIATAEKFDRKVVLLGRGMNNYMDIAFKLGYARPKPGTIISIEEANRLPDNKVTICCTGAQGERYAALMRISTGESKDTTLRPTDTVVFSSSVIPGNERNVQGLFDIIMAQGPRIYQYKDSDIHAGGHARAEDTKKMISLIRPEVYMPVYGYPHMIYGNAKNAYESGYSRDRVIISRNGQIIEFTKDSFAVTDMFVSHRLMTVDGYMVGLTNERDIHDREQMRQSGVVVVSIAKKPGEYLYKIDMAGLPMLQHFDGLEEDIYDFLDATLKNEIQRFKGVDEFRDYAADKVGSLIFDATGKEPVVLVVVH